MVCVELGIMELRCQLRFVEDPQGARAILEACDPDLGVTITMDATGADRSDALASLAERTRDLYGAVCSVVETVEELARTYCGMDDEQVSE